ncbi:unnamed protein product [Cuscuta epithymum]|uniref:Protein kinase domain-containing protein n=1 Tax=Cuscuta epithymum TaxID=186058 RepID=A0AAV0ERC1_9ASTE|nr:unnamed protein product [Cuscuta epithymum]CAH9125777.1 unnamed protein product [Cuscuta epithymum]
MIIYYDKLLGVDMTNRVCEGIYDGRKVAMKCLFLTKGADTNPIDKVEINTKEVQSLVEAGADSHENVVTCYGIEADAEYIYVALDLCSCTLDEVITIKKCRN